MNKITAFKVPKPSSNNFSPLILPLTVIDIACYCDSNGCQPPSGYQCHELSIDDDLASYPALFIYKNGHYSFSPATYNKFFVINNYATDASFEFT